MIKKTKELFIKHKRLILYVIFGGLTTVVDFAISFALYKLVNHHVANVTAWVGAVIFAFVVNKIWVFESKETGFSAVFRELLGFSGGRVASLAMQELIFLVAVDILGVNEGIIKVCASVLVIIVNYILGKLVFDRGAKKGSDVKDD